MNSRFFLFTRILVHVFSSHSLSTFWPPNPSSSSSLPLHSGEWLTSSSHFDVRWFSANFTWFLLVENMWVHPLGDSNNANIKIHMTFTHDCRSKIPLQHRCIHPPRVDHVMLWFWASTRQTGEHHKRNIHPTCAAVGYRFRWVFSQFSSCNPLNMLQNCRPWEKNTFIFSFHFHRFPISMSPARIPGTPCPIYHDLGAKNTSTSQVFGKDHPFEKTREPSTSQRNHERKKNSHGMQWEFHGCHAKLMNNDGRVFKDPFFFWKLKEFFNHTTQNTKNMSKTAISPTKTFSKPSRLPDEPKSQRELSEWSWVVHAPECGLKKSHAPTQMECSRCPTITYKRNSNESFNPCQNEHTVLFDKLIRIKHRHHKHPIVSTDWLETYSCLHFSLVNPQWKKRKRRDF